MQGLQISGPARRRRYTQLSNWKLGDRTFDLAQASFSCGADAL